MTGNELFTLLKQGGSLVFLAKQNATLSSPAQKNTSPRQNNTMQPRNHSFVATRFSSLHRYVAASGRVLSECKKCKATRRTRTSARRHIRACTDSGESQESMNLSESLPVDLSKTDMTADAAAAAAQALFDDLADRPQYYLNISGVLLGIILSCVVLSATVVALDSIPLIPDVLRMVGLAYLFWFLNKFLFSAAERERLGDEISEFVSGVRGASISELEKVEDA